MQENTKKGPKIKTKQFRLPDPFFFSESPHSSTQQNRSTALPKRKMNRWIVYTILALTANLMAGLIGVYTMIKYPISKDFNVEQDFLGFLDALSFFGRVIGSVYLLFTPPKQPKLLYTVSGLAQGISATFIILATFWPQYGKLMLCISMFTFGISRSSVMMIPLLIVRQYFDCEKEKSKINLWMASTHIAEVASLYFMRWTMESLDIKWSNAFAMWIAMFLVSVFLVQFTIKEIQMPQDSEMKKSEGLDGFKRSVHLYKRLLQKKSYGFTILDIVLEESIVFSYMLWLPYYFSEVGMSSSGVTITVMYPIFAIVGSVLMEGVLKKREKIASLTTSLFLAAHTLVILFTIWLDADQQSNSSIPDSQTDNFYLFLVLTSLAGLFIGGPLARITGTEVFEPVKNNEERLMVINGYKISRIIFSVLTTYITGYLMSFQISWLFKSIFVNSIIILMVHIMRRICKAVESGKIALQGQKFDLTSQRYQNLELSVSKDQSQSGKVSDRESTLDSDSESKEQSVINPEKNAPKMNLGDDYHKLDDNLLSNESNKNAPILTVPKKVAVVLRKTPHLILLMTLGLICLAVLKAQSSSERSTFSRYCSGTEEEKQSPFPHPVDPSRIRLSEQIGELHHQINKRYWHEDQLFDSSSNPQTHRQNRLLQSQSFQQQCSSESLMNRKFNQKKGLFESKFQMNFLDSDNSDYATNIRRNLVQIDDINMFSTSLIWLALAQAHSLTGTALNQTQMIESLKSLSDFQDNNQESGTPQYGFWPLKYSEDNDIWFLTGEHLKSAQSIEVENCPIQKAFYKVASKVSNYHIPTDNDDSSVNIALKGLLKQTKLHEPYEIWSKRNSNLESYYRNALKYAYRPFKPIQENPEGDEISGKTYFVLRKFIENKKRQGQDLILPTTWLVTNSQTKPGLLEMNRKANNVQGVVCVNFLYGLSYMILEQAYEPSPQLQQMMLDSVDLINFIVEDLIGNKDGRMDLVLSYYPNEFVFYYFMARMYNLLIRHSSSHNLRNSVIQQIRIKLEFTMKYRVTQNILKAVKVDAQAGQRPLFWSTFLGNYNGVDRNEDSVASTSMALNALFDIWTIRNSETLQNSDKTQSPDTISRLRYVQGTPSEVVSTIQRGIQFLKAHYKDEEKLSNAFFIGFGAHETFPGNVNYDDRDHQSVDPFTEQKYESYHTSYMKGTVESSQYQCKFFPLSVEFLIKTWFGKKVEQTFKGYNQEGLSFPYWNSVAMTQVYNLLTLSKYQALDRPSDLIPEKVSF